jgi:hypothetical protein
VDYPHIEFWKWSDEVTDNPRTDKDVQANITVQAKAVVFPMTLSVTHVEDTSAYSGISITAKGTTNGDCVTSDGDPCSSSSFVSLSLFGSKHTLRVSGYSSAFSCDEHGQILQDAPLGGENTFEYMVDGWVEQTSWAVRLRSNGWFASNGSMEWTWQSVTCNGITSVTHILTGTTCRKQLTQEEAYEFLGMPDTLTLTHTASGATKTYNRTSVSTYNIQTV